MWIDHQRTRPTPASATSAANKSNDLFRNLFENNITIAMATKVAPATSIQVISYLLC